LEGLALITEAAESHDLSIAKVRDPRRPLVEGNATFAPTGERPSERKDPAPEVTNILGLDAKFRPHGIDVGPEPLVARSPVSCNASTSNS
jgi:hypothetical protein